MGRGRASTRPPRAVWVLGIVSFFNDVASEMLYPLLPIFITQVLGAPAAVLGLIDGVAEGAAAAFKAVFGRWSDRRGRRRPFVVAGYIASTVSKLIVAAAHHWGVVFAGRVVDKFGKGVRTGARDALLLDVATSSNRGLVFGLQQSLDSAGAVVGPLVALLLLDAAHDRIRTVLYLAVVPSVLALVLTSLIRDVARPTRTVSATASTPRADFARLPRELKVFLVGSGVFALGNSSDSFLILRSRNVGLSLSAVIVVYVVYNAVYSALSAPAGRLADRVGARRVYLAGVSLYVVVYLGFALTHTASAVWALFTLYGVYIALTDSVSRALVGALITDQSGAAGVFGLQQAITSAGLVLASILGGVLWSTLGSWATFAFGATCALVALAIFASLGTTRPRVAPGERRS
jgi:MFS family permease